MERGQLELRLGYLVYVLADLAFDDILWTLVFVVNVHLVRVGMQRAVDQLDVFKQLKVLCVEKHTEIAVIAENVIWV